MNFHIIKRECYTLDFALSDFGDDRTGRQRVGEQQGRTAPALAEGKPNAF
jgi:hypothetical protein